MKIKQFDIWIADLNPKIGTEPGKIRPVVIVQTDLLNDIHPSVIILPITTNVNRDAEILRVHLKKSTSKLKDDSDVMIDQIRAIDAKRLVKRISSLEPATVSKIKENLNLIIC
jgi:mRNA interferase MazF